MEEVAAMDVKRAVCEMSFIQLVRHKYKVTEHPPYSPLLLCTLCPPLLS